MDLVQIKILNQGSIINYIKIIRKYDNNISIEQIKKNICNSNFVVTFDLHHHEPLEEFEKIDYKIKFRKLIDDLMENGAQLEIYHHGEKITLQLLDNWYNTLDIIAQQIERDIERECEDDEI